MRRSGRSPILVVAHFRVSFRVTARQVTRR
jgi:hypothetical protein